MNCIEHYLPELELSTGQVREALQCIIHTILFIRSPGAVTPCDTECEGFNNIMYTKIASSSSSPNSNSTSPSAHYGQQKHNNPHHPYNTNNVTVMNGGVENNSIIDSKVNDAIENFLKSTSTLQQIGPELLCGSLIISFFERRTTNQLFGLVSHEEKVIWEQWILRVVVNNTPRPINNDSASVIERQRIQDTAESMLRAVLFKIYEIVGGTINHIPPVQYEFEITCAATSGGKYSSSTGKRGIGDDRENVYSRVTNMPPILNLGN